MITRIVNFLYHKAALIGFTALIFSLGLCLFLYSMTMPDPKPMLLGGAQNLLIIATHQDDGVISGGGIAIINDKLGGSTKVIYVLRPTSDEERSIRYQEAHNAWHLLERKSATIEFLDIYPERLTSEFATTELANKINKVIRLESPDIVIFPLEEGGQRHHDMVALTAEVLRSWNPTTKILNAAEYNPLLLTNKMPEKLLMFIVRLLPFVPYYTPNSGIDKNNQLQIELSEDELKAKKEMLKAFESQKDVIPLSQFGYPDLFDTSILINYPGIKILGKTLSLSGIVILALICFYFFYIGSYLGYKVKGLAAHSVLCLIATAPFAVGIISPLIFKEDFLYLALVSFGFYTIVSLRVFTKYIKFSHLRWTRLSN